VTINLARIVGGSIGGGIAAALGLAMCFDLNAVSFLAVLLTLALMSAKDMRPAIRPPREPGQLRAGLAYVRTKPDLLLPLLMVSVIGALAWEFQVSLPLVAKSTFHGGAGMYGVMTSVMAAGAVTGGLVTASRSQVGRRGLAIAAVGWGIAITAAAVAPNLVTEYIALVFVGYGSISFNSLAKTTLQLAAEPAMRGRVMALWAVAWQGSTPVGGPIVGWFGQELGARWSLLVGGVPTLIVGLITLPMLARLDRSSQLESEPESDAVTPEVALDPAPDAATA
jgi:MFS family permease